jgi:integrase
MDRNLPTKIRLTKRSVEALETPLRGERIVWDAALKGFGVRISSTGRRTYFVYARARSGRQIKEKVGVHGAVTVDRAREFAERLLGMIAAGDDPAENRQNAKAAEVERRKAPSIADLASRYLAAHAELKKRPISVRDDRSMLKSVVIPRLGWKRVAEVQHADVEALHGSLSATPYRANRSLALLSKMFDLAVKWRMRADNPAKGVQRYQEHKRERYLRPDELSRLAAVLAGHPNRASANAIRLLLLTGARRSEVLSATWAQFDLDTGVWTKPSASTKQKTEHRVPLSEAALRLLVEIKETADEGPTHSPYVFPSRDGDGPLTDIKRFWERVRTAADIGDVRMHDLRHTFASLLASAGSSLLVIGQLLGHTQPATTARYAHLFDEPLREATAAVAAKLEEFTRPAPKTAGPTPEGT